MFCITCRGRGDALCSVEDTELFEVLGDDECSRELIRALYGSMAAVWVSRIVVVAVRIELDLCFVVVVGMLSCTCNAVQCSACSE